MKKIKIVLLLIFFPILHVAADDQIDFDLWKKEFKKLALSKKISEKTFDAVMTNTKFLPKVIGYDRYQPEFYEDTKTYITKRTSKKKLERV